MHLTQQLYDAIEHRIVDNPIEHNLLMLSGMLSKEDLKSEDLVWLSLATCYLSDELDKLCSKYMVSLLDVDKETFYDLMKFFIVANYYIY